MADVTVAVTRVPFDKARQLFEIMNQMGGNRAFAPLTITPHQMAALAREVAINIRELPDILKNFGLTGEQYARIAEIDFFKHALSAAVIEWTSALKTADRIRIEAAVALEDAMPVLAARMKDGKEGLPAAVEAGKLFAKLAGLGEREGSQSAPGEKFTININLGDGADDKLSFEKDVTPRAPSLGAGALQINTEGASD